MASSKATQSCRALFALALLACFLCQPAHAANCGATIPGSGACGGGTRAVSCTSLLSQGCCQAAGCAWEASDGDDYSCKGALRQISCSNFNNNAAACQQFGCNWAPSASASCSGNNGPQGYGEACTGTTQCAKCLVCDPVAKKCTQPSGVCTSAPAAYAPPPPSSSGEGTGATPQSAIGNLSAGTGAVGSGSGFYKAGWFSDWQAMGIIGVATVCSIIALAAMLGTAFNLPEVKAFAKNELKQAAVSALLIVSLVALVAFFNEIAIDAVNGADLPVGCKDSEPCYITASKFYLQTIYDTGTGYAENMLRESINKMKRANYGYNLNFNKIYFLFAGTSMRFNAGDSLMGERYGAMFSQVSKILASIYAQKYFIDVITFGIAPLFILLGVVLRTFFFTRRLGGLLLAIAISLFIVYPLTYVFAWYTLNVTVYGERTLAVGDPACPGECTATYPTAFFVDGASGKLVQFPTTQSLLRAGITEGNWNSGGPGGKFPGLVACRDLTSIGINVNTAPNACPDCPDYCRDVPFPTGMPGCNITKCSSCNPGCKVVRQRLNCETDPDCAGKCPLICRTRVPTENKCFNNETGGTIPANLSVSCTGCDKYPAWCRFLKYNATTNKLERVYNDPNLNKACEGVENDPYCPPACSYITQIGSEATCDAICSVTNPNTGVRTVCPEECRVANLFNGSWAGMYDINPADASFHNFTVHCSNTPEKAAACKACEGFPECMVEAPMPPPEGCAPYPTTQPKDTQCLSCPEYCRWDDFASLFEPGVSQVERKNSVPYVCDPLRNPDINCLASGTSPACANSCRTEEGDVPKLCRPYEQFSQDARFCHSCPDNARYSLYYQKNKAEYTCNGNTPIYTAPAGEYNIILSGTTSSSQMAAGRGKYGGSTAWLEGGGNPTGQAPIMKSSRIDPTPNAYVENVLSGYCNATAANSGNLRFNYTWYNNSEVYFSEITSEDASSGVEYGVEQTVIVISVMVGSNWTLSCQAIHGNQLSTPLFSNNTTIKPNPEEPACTQTYAEIRLYPSGDYHCDDENCNAPCKETTPVVLPNEQVDPACGDANTTGCPYGCRVKNLEDYIDPECSELCSNLPVACYAEPPNLPICSEYIGSGPKACHGKLCLGLNKAECEEATQYSCTWENGYCDKSQCNDYGAQTACEEDSACKWEYAHSAIPIDSRASPYGLLGQCRQCPEQCRLENYTGACGTGEAGFVDCSLENCPNSCRIPLPAPPEHGECQPYPEKTGVSCEGCPALCRRGSEIMYSDGCPAECQMSADPNKGCTDLCRLEDPPDKPCAGCFDCDTDCTYYPAIRSDCSEVCSDEALAGPVNIEPTDFIKALPGAKTSQNGDAARNIGVLYVPAVVLPLFCIVIVVAFIRVLSPVLGGDIEIPGLGKII